MVSTFETRLDPRETPPEEAAFLDAFAALYGRVLRCLYRERLKERSRNELKAEFQVHFGINARQFNA
ncbi:MAG: IS200/IS605 family accessory protein TnpB-related protein, partial [Opitutales bacterium]